MRSVCMYLLKSVLTLSLEQMHENVFMCGRMEGGDYKQV